jgi:sugar (pentulose or hexulose) kinase
MTRGAVWLSVADYVVWRLTGERVTDPTLAARTYAFDLGSGSWDEEWLDRFGFDAGLFPEVLPSGAPAGTVTTEAAEKTGLSTHTTASVAGHDHICALLGAGIVAPGHVLDSMGTAEAVLGVLDQLELGPNAVASGLAIAPHVVDGLFCWLGGAPSAGASVEWLRELLDGGIIDGDIDRLARAAGDGPTGVIFFPYLMGSGAPCPDPDVRAAFFGLSRTHGREHLVRSVLEGTAFEAESNRRAGIELAGSGEGDVVTVGGGARSVAWMQIKADLSGSPHCVPARQDATCTGAALAAGLRVGVFPDVDEAASLARRSEQYAIFAPDPERHRLYRAAYEERYLVVRESLHELSRSRSESHA